MNISTRILNLANILEHAIEYEDWDSVEETSSELYLLYEELESEFPLEFNENEDDLY